jgi:predicted membrane-bound spermidine synthase
LSAALCSAASAVYALVLAFLWSAYSGRIYSRFALTLCFYFFSLGLGTLLAEKQPSRNTLAALARTETMLAVYGGFSVALLSPLGALGRVHFVFDLCILVFIVVTGLLTGGSLRFMEELGRGIDPSSRIAVVFYAGILAGAGVFAGYVYPVTGVKAGALGAGMANAVAALLLAAHVPGREPGRKVFLLLVVPLLLLPLFLFLLLSGA